jgi:hypothetical protein
MGNKRVLYLQIVGLGNFICNKKNPESVILLPTIGDILWRVFLLILFLFLGGYTRAVLVVGVGVSPHKNGARESPPRCSSIH